MYFYGNLYHANFAQDFMAPVPHLIHTLHSPEPQSLPSLPLEIARVDTVRNVPSLVLNFDLEYDPRKYPPIQFG